MATTYSDFLKRFGVVNQGAISGMPPWLQQGANRNFPGQETFDGAINPNPFSPAPINPFTGKSVAPPNNPFTGDYVQPPNNPFTNAPVAPPTNPFRQPLGPPAPTDPYANVPRNPGRSNQPRKFPINIPQEEAPTPQSGPDFGFPEAPGGFSWDPYNKSLQDFLPDAQELFADALKRRMQGFDEQEERMRGRARSSEDSIRQTFNEYVANTEARAPEIQQRYDQAADRTQQVAQDTAQVSEDAYSSALAQQEALRRSLGMEDVNLRDSETQQADIMQQAVADAASRGQTQANMMGERGQSQLDWNDAMASAGGAQGNMQVANLNRDLLGYLGQVDSQRTETQAQYEDQVQQAAMNLFNMDYGRWADDRNFGAQEAQQNFSRWLAERDFQTQMYDRAEDRNRWEDEFGLRQQQFQFETAPRQETPDFGKLPYQQQLYTLLQQTGFDEGKSNAAVDVFNEALSRGGARDKTTFRTRVMENLARNGWSPDEIRAVLFRADEFFDNYSGD